MYQSEISDTNPVEPEFSPTKVKLLMIDRSETTLKRRNKEAKRDQQHQQLMKENKQLSSGAQFHGIEGKWQLGKASTTTGEDKIKKRENLIL